MKYISQTLVLVLYFQLSWLLFQLATVRGNMYNAALKIDISFKRSSNEGTFLLGHFNLF